MTKLSTHIHYLLHLEKCEHVRIVLSFFTANKGCYRFPLTSVTSLFLSNQTN